MNVRANVERLRKLRMQRNWSQQQLADVAEVSLRTVQRAESGRSIRLDSLVRIARALGVNAEELIVADRQQRSREGEMRDNGNILPRLATADEVLAVMSPGMFYQFGHDQLHSENEVDLVGGFLQLLQDYADLWDTFEASQRVQATFEVQKTLDDLHKEGFWVFGAVVRKKLSVRAFDKVLTDVWPVSTIYIAREDNPAIVKGSLPTIYR